MLKAIGQNIHHHRQQYRSDVVLLRGAITLSNRNGWGDQRSVGRTVCNMRRD